MTEASRSEAEIREAAFRKFQLGKFDPRRAVPAVSMSIGVDIAQVQALRASLNHGLPPAGRVSLTHVLIKAAGATLASVPELYAAFDGRRVVYSERIRINLPVAEGKHVEYVIIDSPQAKSLKEIAEDVRAEVERIREGRGSFFASLRASMRAPRFLSRAVGTLPSVRVRLFNESYGNFPITNFGSFGVEGGVPALASPAIGALCLGKVKEGHPSILPLTLVFDHRCLDGSEGGRFLCALKGVLEGSAETLFD
jgi:pyruvate dehydrogenase E2 component (dihydrolipoamide acetyltransferase)